MRIFVLSIAFAFVALEGMLCTECSSLDIATGEIDGSQVF